MTDRIEAQIERFAPGFRERILARHTMSPAAYAGYNRNYVRGDISGGAHDGMQLFARPVLRRCPTPPLPPTCSSARPPPHRAAACTAWAATMPPARPCAVSAETAETRGIAHSSRRSFPTSTASRSDPTCQLGSSRRHRIGRGRSGGVGRRKPPGWLPWRFAAPAARAWELGMTRWLFGDQLGPWFLPGDEEP